MTLAMWRNRTRPLIWEGCNSMMNDVRRQGRQDDGRDTPPVSRAGDEIELTSRPGRDTARISFHPGMRRPRWHGYTAFILSGGGARGALQAGALRALLEHGIQPDVVIGSSIGSWNGAWLAARPMPDGVEQLIEIWRRAHCARILLGRERRTFSPAALNGMLLFAAARRLLGAGPSLYSNTGLARLLNASFADLTFEDLAIPLGVVATDLTHGTRVVLHSGPVVPALLASSAIPGVFPPVQIGDDIFCDGSELDDVSFDAALALGARRIFVLATANDVEGDSGDRWTHGAGAGEARPWYHVSVHPLAGVIERAAQVSDHHHLERALSHLPIGVERHVISLHVGAALGILDFSSIDEWIERGYVETCDYLAGILPQQPASHRDAQQTADIVEAPGAA